MTLLSISHPSKSLRYARFIMAAKESLERFGHSSTLLGAPVETKSVSSVNQMIREHSGYSEAGSYVGLACSDPSSCGFAPLSGRIGTGYTSAALPPTKDVGVNTEEGWPIVSSIPHEDREAARLKVTLEVVFPYVLSGTMRRPSANNPRFRSYIVTQSHSSTYATRMALNGMRSCSPFRTSCSSGLSTYLDWQQDVRQVRTGSSSVSVNRAFFNAEDFLSMRSSFVFEILTKDSSGRYHRFGTTGVTVPFDYLNMWAGPSQVIPVSLEHKFVDAEVFAGGVWLIIRNSDWLGADGDTKHPTIGGFRSSNNPSASPNYTHSQADQDACQAIYSSQFVINHYGGMVLGNINYDWEENLPGFDDRNLTSEVKALKEELKLIRGASSLDRDIRRNLIDKDQFTRLSS